MVSGKRLYVTQQSPDHPNPTPNPFYLGRTGSKIDSGFEWYLLKRMQRMCRMFICSPATGAGRDRVLLNARAARRRCMEMHLMAKVSAAPLRVDATVQNTQLCFTALMKRVSRSVVMSRNRWQRPHVTYYWGENIPLTHSPPVTRKLIRQRLTLWFMS